MAESAGKSVLPSQKPDNSSVTKPGGAGANSEANEEEYDPVIHRPQENLNSDTEVFMHLFKSTIGSGILFLPYAFRETGTVSSIACSILIGGLATYTAVTTVMTNAMVCFVEYQTVVIYVLYVATSTQQIVEYLSSIVWDIRIYIVISTPIYCLMSVLPNLKYLTPLSVLGSIFMIAGFFVSLYYFFQDYEDPSRLVLYTNVLAMPVYCTIFLFALQNMCVLMPLENSMKSPGHFPVVLMVSMAVSIGIYTFFGLFGYNKYEDACDTVIKNLPLDQPAAQAVKIAITLSIMFGYGIHYFVPVSILWPKISEMVAEDKRTIYEIVFRIGGVICTVLAAVAMPVLGPLLGLFSSLCFSTMTLLFPGIVDLATKWDRSKHRGGLLIKNSFIFLVWIVLLVIGCIESIRQIVLAYGKKKREDSVC